MSNSGLRWVCLGKKFRPRKVEQDSLDSNTKDVDVYRLI